MTMWAPSGIRSRPSTANFSPQRRASSQKMLRAQARAIAKCAEYGSQKHRAMNGAAARSPSAGQAGQIGDAGEQATCLAQQREAVVAACGIFVHHHDGVEKIVHRAAERNQGMQTLAITAPCNRE